MVYDKMENRDKNSGTAQTIQTGGRQMACEKCSANGDYVKHKQRESAEKKALLTRLSRIEGQVRGVRAMVEDDRYCVDIVTQVSAIQAALNGFNKELLARHIKTCVSEDIKEGNEQAVDELCELLKKLMK